MSPRWPASLVLAAALGTVVVPSANLTPAIAEGVTAGGVRIGGLTSEPARARLAARFARPLVLEVGERRWTVRPARLGAGIDVDEAVGGAFGAQAGERLDLRLRLDDAALDAYVHRIALRESIPPVPATLLGLDAAGRPRLAEGLPGIAVREPALRRLLHRALELGWREPLSLPTRVVAPRVTIATFGWVIVIDRGQNRLRLFDGTRGVRSFRVATGQSRYPTPSGTFRIVKMQRNPWWYPPDSPWAQGLSPVAPGPGNPLGTRWMGLSARGVGIHGTPSPASIGYSVSHGCIRMHVPEAEWLFARVRVGTPVVIV